MKATPGCWSSWPENGSGLCLSYTPHLQGAPLSQQSLPFPLLLSRGLGFPFCTESGIFTARCASLREGMGSSSLFLTLFIHPFFLPGILYRADERSQKWEDSPRGGGENDLLQHLLHLPVPRQVLPARAAEAHGGLVSCQKGGLDTWVALPQWGSSDEFGLPPAPELSLFCSKCLCAGKHFLKTLQPRSGYLGKGGLHLRSFRGVPRHE